MSFKTVLTSRVLSRRDIEDFQQKLGVELVTIPCQTEDDIIAAAKDADAVVTLMQPYTRRVIEHLGKCRMIYNAGTGFDSIDLKAATEAGIYVAYTGDYCTEEVAEHAIALLLASARKITRLDRAVREGKWGTFEKREIRGKILPPMFQLKGQILGIIGFGRIGRAIAAKGKGLGLKAIAFDPYLPKILFKQADVTQVTLEKLLERSDFVVIQVASSPETEHIIGMEQFKRMKPNAYIINTARGGVIDQGALYIALSEGVIAGAALDVVEEEPDGIGADHPLLTLDNVIVTAHSAYYSEQSSAKYKERMLEAIVSTMKGDCPEWVANPEVKDRFWKRWGATAMGQSKLRTTQKKSV